VDAADGGSPPPILKLAWLVSRYNTLPDAGGVYDQDAETLYLMTTVENIYDAVTAWNNYGGKQIHSLSKGTRKIIAALRRGGMV
jgi:hypothetical protein